MWSSGTLDVSLVQNTGSGLADRAADKDWLDMLAGIILAASAYVRPGDRGVSVLFSVSSYSRVVPPPRKPE
ncbi:hypothetical protein BFJ69_g17606 [Fusarium oxysporum]|uniref:Uncharacterized protein n=1 Tax=Fusarium oxysporum TaxID=5507 RepID=A0A420M7S1_FUSOX|nr:hypothetical protein BFJ69_g17606 [Fusarium oxysporum]